jgi:hypothetical protein
MTRLVLDQPASADTGPWPLRCDICGINDGETSDEQLVKDFKKAHTP